MFGELAWAASPTRTTRPAVQAGGTTSSIGAKYASPARRADAVPARRSPQTTRASPRCDRGRVARVDVGVAINGPPAKRDGEEAAASAQHDRPIGELGEAVDDEPPGRLSYVAGCWTAQRKAANRRVDAIRADHEVVAAGRAVGEAHLRRLAVLQARHRHAEPDRARPQSPRAAPRGARLDGSLRTRRRRPTTGRRRCRRVDDRGGRRCAASRSDSHGRREPTHAELAQSPYSVAR